MSYKELASFSSSFAHDHQALECLFNVDQRSLHDLNQLVLSYAFLEQHCVQTLLVFSGLLFVDSFDVEEFGGARLHLGGQFLDLFLPRFARSGCRAGLHGEDSLQHDCRLVLGVGYLGVVVQTEGLWGGVEGQLVDVLEVVTDCICAGLLVDA